MKNLLFRLIAVVLGFAAAFGLAEIAVRTICPQETGPVRFAFNPVLGEIPVPNQEGRQVHPGNFDFTYSNNSLGFRGSREYGPKKPGEFRLLLLGDSFTYGLGVNDHQTYGYHLQQSLRRHHLNAVVINAGNPGHGTEYALKLFQTVGAGLRPDVTVLGFFPAFFGRDAQGEYYTIGPHGELSAKKLQPATGKIKTFLFHFPGYSWLISWSQAANLVKQAAVNYLVQDSRDHQGNGGLTSSLVTFSKPGATGFSNAANRKLAEIYLNHLREAVRQANSELLVCYIPISSEVEAYRRTGKISRDEQTVKDIVGRQGGVLLSLTPVLAADPEPIRALYYPEGHWTPRSDALAGNYLGIYLREKFPPPAAKTQQKALTAPEKIVTK
jgi:hypothetical protein